MVLINDEIKATTVKIITDDGSYLGNMNTKDAIFKAKTSGKDLICINEKSDPPLCKIQDFGKYQYQLKKNTKKPKIPELKEIKIRPNTDVHDLGIKAKHVNEFIQNKHKVKIIMVLSGREVNNIDFANETFDKFINMLESYYVDIPRTKTNNQIYIQIKGA